MSRTPARFTQGDVSRAIKATVKAGVKDWRLEIADGKAVLIVAEPAGAPDTDHETSADVRKLL